MYEKDVINAVAFFKSEFAYKRLFVKFRKKYESLGRIGGNVSIESFPDEELEVIGGFFGLPTDLLRAKKSISIIKFEAQLQETRFENVGLKDLLDAYFGEVIISKKQLQAERNARYKALLDELTLQYPVLRFWLEFLSEKPAEGRWIVRMAMDNQSQFVTLVGWLAEAMELLPSSAERLPMFSQRVAQDPHAFDLHTELGKLLIHALTVRTHQGEREINLTVPKSTEAVNELLQQSNIYRDDLLNFVTCAGFYAETAQGVHPIWLEAVRYQTVQNVPLRELVKLKRVYPAYGKNVWVVENSGVCSTLLDYEAGIPIISTNGQFKLAALLLLDLLAAEGCTLHYAGDFDPEGLGMAQRLMDRYPDHVKIWHMDLANYRKTLPVKELSRDQIEKLNSIENHELLKVAEEMRRIGKAGYQEALVEEMLADLRKGIAAE